MIGPSASSARSISAARPGRLPRRQHLEPGGDQDPVLVGERDQIGDRSERHQIEQLARIEGGAEAGAQRRRQVEGDAAGGEPLEREGVVGAARIDQRVGRRLAGRQLVVVDDDDVEAARAAGRQRLVIAGAAVAGDEHPAAVGGEARHVVDAETVTGAAAGGARR